MNTQSKYNFKNQSEAVIHFLQRLDIEMVDAVLEDNRTYQDFEKPVFIHKLTIALDEFVETGDSFLNVTRGEADCNHKCKRYSFIGNNSGNHLDMIMDVKDGVVQDMYECSFFEWEIGGVERKKRIGINKFGRRSLSGTQVVFQGRICKKCLFYSPV